MLLLVSYLAVAGRILFLALERAAIKRLGEDSSPMATTLVFFATATLSLVPISGHAVGDYFRGPSWVNQPAHWWVMARVLLGAALVYTLAFMSYSASLATGEISVVGPLAHVNALFLLVLAFWFHHEPLTAQRVAGTAMVVWGGIVLGRTRSTRGRRAGRARVPAQVSVPAPAPAVFFMLAYAFLLAVGRVIDKYATVTLDVPTGVYTLLTYSSVTLCLALVCGAGGTLKEARVLLTRRPRLSVLAGVFTAYAFFFLVVAIQNLDLTVVEPLSGLAALVNLWLGSTLFGENLAGKTAPSALIVLGSSLILA